MVLLDRVDDLYHLVHCPPGFHTELGRGASAGFDLVAFGEDMVHHLSVASADHPPVLLVHFGAVVVVVPDAVVVAAAAAAADQVGDHMDRAFVPGFGPEVAHTG